jgi:hypothetical protein
MAFDLGPLDVDGCQRAKTQEFGGKVDARAYSRSKMERTSPTSLHGQLKSLS